VPDGPKLEPITMLSTVDDSYTPLARAIAQLLRAATIEINVADVPHLETSRRYLAPGTSVYVSHLPKQTFQQTQAACQAVRAAGFDPVPHVPVRLILDADTLDRILAAFVGNAGARNVLLIAGDYPQAVGPYAAVADVLRSGALTRHGLARVSAAGHPEGHPKISLAEVRGAEREKAQLAADAGLDLTLVTQFFFEAAPFLEWVHDLRARGIEARVVAGLAGPAGIATLFKFAMRCGAGPSIRALGARPTAFVKLLGEHGPEAVIRGLAAARCAGETDFSGIHFFCFGGYLRTCEWLSRAAAGPIRLNERGGFDVVS
jgi:methylenetetrahydrofolate reductase (NADH)